MKPKAAFWCAGEVDVLAFHDAHVDVERLVAERALAVSDRVGGRDSAVEVEYRRGIAGAEEVEVEVGSEDVGRARTGLGAPGCRGLQPSTHACRRQAAPPMPADAPAINAAVRERAAEMPMPNDAGGVPGTRRVETLKAHRPTLLCPAEACVFGGLLPYRSIVNTNVPLQRQRACGECLHMTRHRWARTDRSVPGSAALDARCAD